MTEFRTIHGLSDLPPDTPVFIFGASRGGQTLRNAIRSRVPVAAFIDSYKTGSLDGLPILKLEDAVSAHGRDLPILIASMYAYEIGVQARRHGCTNVANAHPYVMNILAGKRKNKTLALGAGAVAIVALLLWLLF